MMHMIVNIIYIIGILFTILWLTKNVHIINYYYNRYIYHIPYLKKGLNKRIENVIEHQDRSKMSYVNVLYSQ